MQTYTMAELGKITKKVCNEGAPTLITNNGKPQNIILNVSELPIDESVALAQELYGQYCIRELRAHAKRNGLDALTDEEIEAEIDAVRSSRA